jgi:lipopolysaccharide transport system permease protein
VQWPGAFGRVKSSMGKFGTSPKSMLQSFVHNRALVAELTKREIVGRYKGSVLGVVWSLIIPLLMMAVYTFVFSVVFKAKWSADSQSKSEFALILFAGLMVFNVFAETINRAPSLILSSPNYVKKVLFPLEILPIVSLLTSLFHLSVNLLVWVLFYLLFIGLPPATFFLFALAVLPVLFLTLGLGWFLSSLGVYLRDTSQILGVLTSILLFMSPIFYPLTALPKDFQSLLKLNPLGYVIETSRGVLMWGDTPALGEYLWYLAASIALAWFGYYWFQRTRKGFADVL